MPLTTYSTHREGLPVPPVPRYEEKEPNALRRTTIQAAALAGSIISRRNVRKDNLLEGIIYKVVNSAIKSLECAADISQVNVTQDTEAVPSGHGSGHVQIEETDASKNADEPIQDNSLESDEEDDREPIVHTDVISERKRKNSAASSSDVSTTPRTRKKVKITKINSTQAKQVLTRLRVLLSLSS